MHTSSPESTRQHTLPQVLPWPRPGLDDDAGLPLEIDIAFSTHLTLVVPARLEFSCGAEPREVDLVIARARCRHRRPTLKSLLDAVPPALTRSLADRVAGGRPAALWARVAGQWQALCAWPAGGTGHAPHMA